MNHYSQIYGFKHPFFENEQIANSDLVQNLVKVKREITQVDNLHIESKRNNQYGVFSWR